MFTLRHRDADLIRFDWLPDRGGRQEVRVDRVFPAAKRFAPIELRANPTDEALGRWLRGRTVPANRAYVRNFLAKQGLNERDTRGIRASTSPPRACARSSPSSAPRRRGFRNPGRPNGAGAARRPDRFRRLRRRL